MRARDIEALTLYQQKIKELEYSKFIEFFIKPNNQNSQEPDIFAQRSIIKSHFNEPPEEAIRSFILIYRFFVQDNEECALGSLKKNVFPYLKKYFPKEVKEFNYLREFINEDLDSQNNPKLILDNGKEQKELNTLREILDIFCYGNYAHANIKKDKKKWYDFLHLNSDESYVVHMKILFRFFAISTLVNISKILVRISMIIERILDKTIEYYISEAIGYLERLEFDQAINFYRFALTIVNKLELKKKRAELHKCISDVFKLKGDKKNALIHLNKFKDIKNSIKDLPADFWNDEYYRDFFSIPQAYLSLLQKVHGISKDFSKEKIIILPIERLVEVKRFEKLLVAKNFRVSKNKERLIFYYEQLISIEGDKSYWGHFKFEFNPKEEYLCRFPFRDDSGILFITNSPILFIKNYCYWLVEKRIFQKYSCYYDLLFHYIDILISIELDQPLNQKIFKKLKEKRANIINSIAPDTLPDIKSIAFLNKIVFKILRLIINISIYPKLKKGINFEKEMELIKKRDIEPFSNNQFKGQSWFSFALTVVLYTLIARNESFFNQVKDSEMVKLKEICEIINGKPINVEFFTLFFDFCENYIFTYHFKK